MVEPIEVVWACISGTGILLAVGAVIWAHRDIDYLFAENGQPAILRQTDNRIWRSAVTAASARRLRNILRATIQVAGFAAGVGSMFRPPPTSGQSIGRTFILLLLMAMNAGVTAETALDLFYREKLHRDLEIPRPILHSKSSS